MAIFIVQYSDSNGFTMTVMIILFLFWLQTLTVFPLITPREKYATSRTQTRLIIPGI